MLAKAALPDSACAGLERAGARSRGRAAPGARQSTWGARTGGITVRPAAEAAKPSNPCRFCVTARADDTERVLGVNSVVRRVPTLSHVGADRGVSTELCVRLFSRDATAQAAGRDARPELRSAARNGMGVGTRSVTATWCPFSSAGSRFVDQERCSRFLGPPARSGGRPVASGAGAQRNDIAAKKGEQALPTSVDNAEMRKVASFCCSDSWGTMSARRWSAAKNWAAGTMPASLGASLASREGDGGRRAHPCKRHVFGSLTPKGAREIRKEPS